MSVLHIQLEKDVEPITQNFDSKRSHNLVAAAAIQLWPIKAIFAGEKYHISLLHCFLLSVDFDIHSGVHIWWQKNCCWHRWFPALELFQLSVAPGMYCQVRF